jgi:transcription elongation factor
MAIQATAIDDTGTERAMTSTAGDVVTLGSAHDVATAELYSTDDRQEAAVRDVIRMAQAARDLRAVLEAHEKMYEHSLARLNSGIYAGRALLGVDVAHARASLADALAEFERARHHARGTFISAQFHEGMNMKQIGNAWGISRQLAHRFFKEAQHESA